jgi:hypothetical protein
MFMLPVFFIREPVPAVVPPFMEVPVVVLLAAGPPACEPPPAVLPPDCAKASELVIAKAAAKMIVLTFMIVSFLAPHQANAMAQREFQQVVGAS